MEIKRSGLQPSGKDRAEWLPGISAISNDSSTRFPTSGVFAALLPIMAVVLVAFLVMGLSLPILPLHVTDGLGLGAFVVGLVTGSQFAA